MTNQRLYQKSLHYLSSLCNEITERCVGSEGNRRATDFFENELSSLGWQTESSAFDAMDWEEGGATIICDGKSYNACVSPYSVGFRGEGELVSASTLRELETIKADKKIILLHGEIAREQLMPKNFVFYNPEGHQKIIAALERSGAKAIICSTGRNAALAGGVYPFPLIEDGDFNIPSVYMTEEEGKKLVQLNGNNLFMESISKRIPGKGFNVTGRKGNVSSPRIVITAHIDSKKGSPGAIDNATGVVVLLLLADLLKEYTGNRLIEIVAFNGEDYYAASGQMNYVADNFNKFNEIMLNINIDGAGYREGPSAFSLFDLPDRMQHNVLEVISHYEGITEGEKWPQGDHSIFIQFGVPAIAVSSKWFVDNMNLQEITHTPKDNPGVVDCNKLVEIALALDTLVRRI